METPVIKEAPAIHPEHGDAWHDVAELTVEDAERIARNAIRERLRNAAAEQAILDVSPGGPPNTVLLHINSGGNALAAETALTAAGYLVDSRPAEHGMVLGVALVNGGGLPPLPQMYRADTILGVPALGLRMDGAPPAEGAGS